MTTKACVAVALAVWMTWAGFLALPANAATPHVVAGGLFGPGGSPAPGPANPANEATFVFYSTTVPANTLLAGADAFNVTDGTNPAFYFKDVGSPWTWSAGESITVVGETVRGVNGWANVNYTSSWIGTLNLNNTQDLGNANLEQVPPLTLTGGPGYVNVAWTALTDATTNLASYHLYRAPGGSLTTVPHAAGPRSYNNTGLAGGTYCYELAVQYRRDATGGTYETTGRSEPRCTPILAAPPRIVSTNPANGAPNVAVNVQPTVTFDQAITQGTFTYTFLPGFNFPASTPTWVGNTVTFNHLTDLTVCTPYTITITNARNVDNTPLAGPNAFTFTTVCPNPFIVSTIPVNGATSVPRSTNVVIQFSKPMNTAVVVTGLPSVTCTWNGPTNDQCTIAETLGPYVPYFVNVSGTDTLGNALVPGPVPGCCGTPFSFRSNAPPAAAFTAPGTNLRITGGTDILIQWTMSDTETATANLRVWLNYTYGATTLPITSLTGATQYTWTTPTPPSTDKTVTILLNVVDEAKEFNNQLSNPVDLDYTAPTAILTTPTPGATNVLRNANVTITFSETMNPAATEAAISISPTAGTPTFSWWNNGMNVAVGHAVLAANTTYTLTIAVTATDTSTPGNPLASAYAPTFMTGAQQNRPNPPTGVTASNPTTSSITLGWTAPTTWVDTTALQESDITEYKVYRSTSATAVPTFVASVATRVGGVVEKAYTNTGLDAGTTYYYWVSAVAGGQESDLQSAPRQAQTSALPPAEFNWLLVAIPLIVIILLIVAFLLLRKKKPAGAPPKGPEATKAPPMEEPMEEATKAAPSEAETPAEEAGEKFIPCPNCGTMVKPTDAECFVCGAKL